MNDEGQTTGKLLTPKEVADRLGVHRRRVVTRHLRNELPWIFIGPRSMRLPEGALEAFLLERTARDLRKQAA